MDAVIAVVALFLAASLAAVMHSFIKPVVDWIYPPMPTAAPPPGQEDPCDQQTLQRREAKKQRDASRAKQRLEDERLAKELQRLEAKMDRQHAAEAAREQREWDRFWRDIERIERKSQHYNKEWWDAFKAERES